MRNRHRQRGLTMSGFIFTAIVVVTAVMIGFRTMPSYIEYFTVKKILTQILESSPPGTPLTLVEARRLFDRRSGADYIESVAPSDVELQKNGNQITLSASWTKTLHLVGNVSLLLDFEATATR
jgi:Domain of unknown function (DUF4845)